MSDGPRMQAVVLAGGRGTRLRPYTVTFPKPLVPIGDRPILEIILLQLRDAGVDEVILSTGHMAELIHAYFGDGAKWGLRLRHVREEAPLSTAGPLRLIDGLRDDFIVMNGDVLTDMDLRGLWEAHRAAGAAATVAVRERAVPIDFGVVEVDPQGRLAAYTEKPTLRYQVSMGINVLNARCLRLIKPGEALAMPDLLLRAKAAGEDVRCHVTRAAWLDIGRPEDYEEAQRHAAPGSAAPGSSGRPAS